jgi:hypothetical protein
MTVITAAADAKPPRATPHSSEKNLQKACMKRIREQWHGEAYHPIGTGASSSGEPDIIGVIPVEPPTGVFPVGRHAAVELKQPGNEPTAKQAQRLRTYADKGSLAGWATTEAELDEILSHADDPTWTHPDYPHFRPKAHARGEA